ncbi:MAG TPA: SMP-30/gluconolactonase/LRE family protein, partial [Acidisoma sp.]|nr:SMP-30/gluconolactonase/LRE family protein [Acidisoma sp.]
MNPAETTSEVTPIWTGRAQLGEGPLWSARLDQVFFVDINGRRILSCGLGGEAAAEWTLDHRPCWLIETGEPDRFVVGLDHGIVTMRLTPGEPAEMLHRITWPGAFPAGLRLNDAKADAGGRIYFGSMDDAEEAATGHFYALAPDGTITHLDTGYTVANGPAVSPDGRTVYHTDSSARTIYAFDRSGDGTLAGKRVHIRFTEADGYPDGMTCDAEGGLWVCHWDGGRVTRFRPDGSRDRAIPLPVSRVTSCCFVGPALDRLVITTAAFERE